MIITMSSSGSHSNGSRSPLTGALTSALSSLSTVPPLYGVLLMAVSSSEAQLAAP
jgi:hypothetical protein